MGVVIAKRQLELVAYDGGPTGPVIGTATRDAARALWTVKVGGTVRRRRCRRAAARTLTRLAYAALIDRAIAGSPLPGRREAVGGGVQQTGGVR